MNALGFAIQQADLPGLLAAIDQMIDRGHHDCIDDDHDNEWTGHTVADGWVQFHGPVYVYGLHRPPGGEAWVDSPIIEFDYHDLGGLREEVASAVEYVARQQFRAERIGTWPTD
ncbi:MAG TPA: hypothetical protein VNS46_15350 [Nocardioides sp.]|nr:hypothetical protein [Nocardioides sp.]